MPTYDYQCEACGKVIEVFHAMSESGPEFCDCEARGRLQRLLSAGSGLIFKGSGFYITDYAKKGSNGSCSSPACNPASSSSSSTEPSTSEKSEPAPSTSGDAKAKTADAT